MANRDSIKEKIKFYGRSGSVGKTRHNSAGSLVMEASNQGICSLSRGVVNASVQQLEANSSSVWWLCVEFLQDRDVYEVGRYIINQDLKAISVLIGYSNIGSLGAAIALALKESVQCAC